MSQADLFEECPDPVNLRIGVTCGNCLHFSDIPCYSVGGSKTVCSNDRIGRRAEQIPCPHFSVNTSILKKLTSKSLKHLMLFLASIDADLSHEKSRKEERKDQQLLLQLSLIFRAMYSVRKQGFELGGRYRINDKLEGVLVAIEKTHVTIRTDKGMNYTVERGIPELISSS